MLLIDIEKGREVRREERSLSQADLPVRADEFLRLAASVLICGAISAPLEALLVSSGVHVIGFVCGPVEEVIAAFLNGAASKPELRMPGCQGWRQRVRTGHRARAGGGGRLARPFRAGPGELCVCPNCGEKAPPMPGRRWSRMPCPKCGTAMTRT